VSQAGCVERRAREGSSAWHVRSAKSWVVVVVLVVVGGAGAHRGQGGPAAPTMGRPRQRPLQHSRPHAALLPMHARNALYCYLLQASPVERRLRAVQLRQAPLRPRCSGPPLTPHPHPRPPAPLPPCAHLCRRMCSMPTGSGGAPKFVMRGTDTLLGYSITCFTTYCSRGGGACQSMCLCVCVFVCVCVCVCVCGSSTFKYG
jgi:hypothetical protein